MFFLDPSSTIDWSALQKRPSLSHPDCIQPLFAPPPYFDPLHCTTAPMDWWGWRATGGLARRILREPAAWRPNPVALIETIQHWSDPPRWQSTPIDLDGIDNYPITSPPVLNASSSVLVVLSFFRCEEWLNACLTGVTRQTRPPENIVVIDDCSPKLPLDLVEPFPNVTLLSTTRNIGPERILNNIIHATHYDAYMVQDPDDWSAHDRLEASLRGAEHSGAGLVASHEFRVNVLRQSLAYSIFPPDVNAAMARNTTHCILHPTSLISRALAMRVGGLDERLKVGADTEFHIRAVHAGRLVNLPGFYSFRRVRSGSMTTDPATGYGSAVRASEDEFITTSSRRNLALAESGQTPNFVVPHKDPVGFIHHRGPRLRLSERGLLV